MEENYRKVVENANEAVMVVQGGKIMYANPKAMEISGYPKEELMYKPFDEIIHPEDRELVTQYYNDRISGKKSVGSHQFRFKDKEGKTRWGNLKVTPIQWDGKPATLSFITDITAQKEVEEETEKKSQEQRIPLAKEELQEIAERAPVGIICLDGGFHITYENPKAKEIMGVPPGEESDAMGVDVRELSSVVKAGISKPVDSLLRGENVEIETRFESIYGKETFLRVYGVPLHRGGDFNGGALILEDITERKRAEEVFQQSKNYYKAVLENTGSATFIIEEDTTISMASKKLEELSGYSKEEIEVK